MDKYANYLPELKTTTLFQNLTDEEILSLLEAFQPEIFEIKKGDSMGSMDFDNFRMILKTSPAQEIQPRRFPFDMPKFGEPGMLMGEIPSFSEIHRFLDFKKRPPHKPKPLSFDMTIMEFSRESLTKFYSESVSKAQGVFLRNMLGILAQKVTDVRQELFKIRDGRDIYADIKE